MKYKIYYFDSCVLHKYNKDKLYNTIEECEEYCKNRKYKINKQIVICEKTDSYNWKIVKIIDKL